MKLRITLILLLAGSVTCKSRPPAARITGHTNSSGAYTFVLTERRYRQLLMITVHDASDRNIKLWEVFLPPDRFATKPQIESFQYGEQFPGAQVKVAPKTLESKKMYRLIIGAVGGEGAYYNSFDFTAP